MQTVSIHLCDSNFNGDLELPDELRSELSARYTGQISSELAGGQIIEEDAYLVEFPCDGEIVSATTTFVAGNQILIGTNLLREPTHELGSDVQNSKFAAKQLRGTERFLGEF